MSDVLATAQVNIVVNMTSLNSQLATVRSNIGSTSAVWSRNLTTLSRNINRLAAPLVAMSKIYMATFIAGSTKALHALAQMHTVEGRAWKRQVDIFRTQFQYEMARVGALLLRSPIFRTLPQWMNLLIAWLRRLDLSKVREMVKWFERAAIMWASLKAITMTVRLGAGLTGFVNAVQKMGKMIGFGGVANAVGGLGQAGSALMGAGAGAGVVGGATLKSLGRLPLDLEEKRAGAFVRAWNKAIKAGATVEAAGIAATAASHRAEARMLTDARKIARIRVAGGVIPNDLGLMSKFSGLATMLGRLTVITALVAAAFFALSGVASGLGINTKNVSEAMKMAWGWLKAGVMTVVGVLKIFSNVLFTAGRITGILIKAWASFIIFGKGFKAVWNTMKGDFTSAIDDMGTKLGNAITPLTKPGENGMPLTTLGEMAKKRAEMVGMGDENKSGRYMAGTEIVKDAQSAQNSSSVLATMKEQLEASLGIEKNTAEMAGRKESGKPFGKKEPYQMPHTPVLDVLDAQTKTLMEFKKRNSGTSDKVGPKPMTEKDIGDLYIKSVIYRGVHPELFEKPVKVPSAMPVGSGKYTASSLGVKNARASQASTGLIVAMRDNLAALIKLVSNTNGLPTANNAQRKLSFAAAYSGGGY